MHKQTIALVDDDRNILTSLSIALEKEGFKVQTYIDGESALIGLTRTPPDLAIVDIKMPKMDGEELLKKIRKRYIWANFTNTSSENFYSKQEERYFLHNAFAFYKKSFLVENPFDENLAGKEDRYWANHIIKNDHKIFYDSSQSVLHHYTSNGATWKGIG